MLKRVCFVLAILMVHSSASACSDLNGDGVVNVADFLILVDDFGKTVTCVHAEKVQLVIQNQFNNIGSHSREFKQSHKPYPFGFERQ